MREIQNYSMVFKSYFDYNQREARKKFVLEKCLCSIILGENSVNSGKKLSNANKKIKSLKKIK
jgi:hypothetical protein